MEIIDDDSESNVNKGKIDYYFNLNKIKILCKYD
jgi:hypothetical protein